MIIKEQPHDFIVNERMTLQFNPAGDYAYYLLQKTNWNTPDAIDAIAATTRTPLKHIGYAGNKDKHAVTEQHLSIYKGTKDLERTTLKDITLTYLGRGTERITLGSLTSNAFAITARELTAREPLAITRIKNYFDTQRLGHHNRLAAIGKALITRQFAAACTMLDLHPVNNDCIGALRTIGKKRLLFHVHAYQSLLFNRFLDTYTGKARTAPLIGFLTEYEHPSIKRIYDAILRDEGITAHHFLVNQLPDISSEGSTRTITATVANFTYAYDNDDLHPNKYKCVLTFELPPGAYATIVVKTLFRKHL